MIKPQYIVSLMEMTVCLFIFQDSVRHCGHYFTGKPLRYGDGTPGFYRMDRFPTVIPHHNGQPREVTPTVEF